MKFVIIFGPQAVGKMTVGQELEKITGLKLFHNHMTIELVSQFFNHGTESHRRVVDRFRKEMFKEVASSDLKGLIFTYVWAFNEKSDWEFIEEVSSMFKSQGGDVYYVELEADTDERLKRNRTENRLAHKPSKRNIDFSEQELKSSMLKHRFNSLEGEVKEKNYLKINNTHVDPASVASQIKDAFSL